jgi:hypothetical protein
MRTLVALSTVAAGLWAPAWTAQAPNGSLLLDILPPENLVRSSVAAVPDQTALNAYYYLADESVLALGRKTDAVFARYRAETGEALLLAVAYPSAREAGGAYGRFGADFFSHKFKRDSSRFLEQLESGDYAAAAVRGRVLIIVLEAPDRDSCADLIRRVEERTSAWDRS